MAPDLPPGMDAFFAQALARVPEERFQTARELSVALAEVVGLRLSTAELPAPISARTFASEVDLAAPKGRAPQPSQPLPPAEPAASRAIRPAVLWGVVASTVVLVLTAIVALRAERAPSASDVPQRPTQEDAPSPPSSAHASIENPKIEVTPVDSTTAARLPDKSVGAPIGSVGTAPLRKQKTAPTASAKSEVFGF